MQYSGYCGSVGFSWRKYLSNLLTWSLSGQWRFGIGCGKEFNIGYLLIRLGRNAKLEFRGYAAGKDDKLLMLRVLGDAFVFVMPLAIGRHRE
jgi:hypothetical protein